MGTASASTLRLTQGIIILLWSLPPQARAEVIRASLFLCYEVHTELRRHTRMATAAIDVSQTACDYLDLLTALASPPIRTRRQSVPPLVG